ncbi:isochorismatase family protein [Anaerocolumna xylanovorans]|uniref:Bifunctional isochorismate lyase / aryl carrier protein n=1 Tax=Anaerocolumna xylanovorans DSM 12503 TaxID=1121345 RepID=A0A1M7YI97_9FIRM|nr:isochorismatase family protein [Anaerocolumna xylanovorans]SHO52299.1 bifunctional isochorismate lyase / aryl carrier protein [Anaerocolumna xylanovorans DSM 12503]
MGIGNIKDYNMPILDNDMVNKANWAIEPQNAILLIHDMQQYFIEPYGRESLVINTIIANIKKIKLWCKKCGIPVVYSAQPAGQTAEQRGLLLERWGMGIPANMGKENIVPELSPQKEDIVIQKRRYNAFEKTNLETLIRENEKNQLIICGVYGHIGCLATALCAYTKDIKPIVVSDGVADFSYEKHVAALQHIGDVCGLVVDTNRLIGVMDGGDVDET